MTHSLGKSGIWGSIALVLLAVAPAAALVETIDATVTSEIQQFLGAELINSDLAFKDLQDTAVNLPLSASTGFVERDGEEVFSVGDATTSFTDPRLSSGLDPDEFGIDVVVASRESSYRYTGRSAATETRQIVFTPGEIGRVAGTEVEVTSEFFVDGLVMIVGNWSGLDQGTTLAEMTLSVVQTLPDSEEPSTVLEASLSLVSQPDGTATLQTSGSITPDNVILIDASSFIEEFESAYFVLIPNTGIRYTFPSRVDEQFILDAAIEGRVQNQTETVAVVALGVPIEDFLEVISEATGEDVSDELGSAVTFLIGNSGPPLKPLPATLKGMEERVLESPGLFGLPWPACGAMGVESLLLTGFLPLVLVRFRRR